MGGETGIHPDVLMFLLEFTVLQTPLARAAPGRTEAGLLRLPLRSPRGHLSSAKSFDVEDGWMDG